VEEIGRGASLAYRITNNLRGLHHPFEHTLRNLRHTGASLAVASGADLEHVKVRMGHESIATTSRFYLQMYEGRDAEIARRLEELANDPDSQRRLRGSSEPCDG